MTGLYVSLHPLFIPVILNSYRTRSEEVRSNFRIMKDIAQHTIIPPASRRASLEDFIKSMYANAEITTELKKWSIDFDQKMVNISARVLNPEPISFLSKRINYAPAQGTQWFFKSWNSFVQLKQTNLP